MKFLRIYKLDRWSPYLSGVLIGTLAATSLIIFKKTLGVSTALIKPAAFICSLINRSHFEQNDFYREVLNNRAWIDWQLMLVIGLFLGSLISRYLAGSTSESGPASRFNLRPLLGGFVLMLGARLAGGCTSGHAITGGFQLAVSGYLFMMGLFVIGIPAALFLYSKNNGGR